MAATPLPGPGATCLEAALAYAARGWPVLPLHWPTEVGCSCELGAECTSIGKHPRIKGKDEAGKARTHVGSLDAAEIRGWWHKWPRANVGIVCSAFLVLDVDGFVGEVSLEDLEEDHGPLPRTLEVRTGGGGRHLIFRHPTDGGPPVLNKVSAAPKLDSRSHGGLVVAAPSLHASGARYEWVDPDVEIADLGAHHLLHLLRTAKAAAKREGKPPPPPPKTEGRGTDRDLVRVRGILRAACERISRLADGRRQAVLVASHQVGGYLHYGLDFAEAEAALLDAGRRSGTKHPLVREVRYGLETGMHDPLTLPPDDDPPPKQTRSQRPPEPPVDSYDDVAGSFKDASAKPPPKRTRPGVLARLERVVEICGLGDSETRAAQIASLHGEVDELAAAWADHETEIRAAMTQLRAGRGASAAVSEILRLVIRAAERLAEAREQAQRQVRTTSHDIRLGPDLDRVEEETVAAIAARDEGLFTRAAQLVQVVEDRLVPVDRWHLRSRLTKVARFMATKADGAVVHVPPPIDLVQGVLGRRSWPGIRPITAVVHEPILRPDGTVLQAEGYDAATATIYQPTERWPAVPSNPTLEDAQEAAGRLLETVSTFPVASTATWSAWLAAVLTPLARFAFRGPAPWFLWTANVRGTGKSLMASAAAIIATGEDPAATSAPERDEEMRKILTACALASKRLVLWDNLVGEIGWPSLDAVLTSSRHGDRILGSSTQIDVPMTTVWYGTANSPVFRADTSRRVLPIPLDSQTPNPEHRVHNGRRDLKAWLRAHRPELAVDALTCLRAYCAAGRPAQDLPPWGSYEGWSALVRGAVVWMGYPDPSATTQAIGEVDLGQVSVERLAAAVWRWRRDAWWKVSELQADLQTDHTHALVDLDAAVRDFTDDDKVNARKIGKRLIRLRGRLVRLGDAVFRLEARYDSHVHAYDYRVAPTVSMAP